MSATIPFAVATILIVVMFDYPTLKRWHSEGMKPSECFHNMSIENIIAIVAVLVAIAAIIIAILDVVL